MSSEQFHEYLHEALDIIDRSLAKSGTSLSMRPLKAASDFVNICILEVSTDGGKTSRVPGEFSKLLQEEWFGQLMRDVTEWYRLRYGDYFQNNDSSKLRGVILVFDTPFSMDVPISISTPAKPGETSWLEFPDHVQRRENSLEWIKKAPILPHSSTVDFRKARRDSKAVATALRLINSNVMGAGKNPQGDGFLSAIVPNLERAAEQIVRNEQASLKRAHWDMQMACEAAFKALAQERSGSFKKSHDLLQLFDSIPGSSPTIARGAICKLPNWKTMSELRYGRGPHRTLRQTYRIYRSVLRIVSSTATQLKGFKIGKARFEIRRAPWLKG